jgi:hypothetical protein
VNHSTQQLMLLAARERLSPEQRVRAAELARDVDDWDTLTRIATRALGLCLVYRSLAALPAGSVPDGVLASMKLGARVQAARSLLIESTYRHFVDQCLAPSGAAHVFFKGPTLSARYYDSPAHRPCRDVDVLVEEAGVLDVLLRARAHGYRPYGTDGVETDRDFAAWVKYGSVFPMQSPSNVLVEIHKSLDHGEGHFDSRALIARAEQVTLRDHQVRVLRTADLFTYICMHHTRHFWSHLHWFSDLDALSAHESFDLEEVRQVAQQAGLLSTVEACLGLNQLAASGRWTLSPAAGPEHALLDSAVTCLIGGRASEDAMKATRVSSDRAFAWQLTFLGGLTYRLGWLARKARPNFTDYRAMPLPAALQPLYYVTRPFRVLALLLSGKSPGAGSHAGAGGGH